MRHLLPKVYRLLLILVIFGAGVGVQRIGLIDYLLDPYEYPLIIKLFWQHLYLVGCSMGLATVAGLSVGILLTRRQFKKYAGVGMYIVSLGQTIPSLAVIALAMSFLGIGATSAIFALTIYSILPIARNTLAGIMAVPPPLIDAAQGMGMPPWRLLLEVELPMAMKVIITGFRVALIINIGTAALAFLIGAGGLGDLIFSGISLMEPDKLLAGAIPLTLLALLGDYLCELVGLLLIPPGLRLEEG
ncbi:MAG: ABC transporter permease [Deltaproteobacteria bacterium]|nr:ABC transporter permease [Deltaproteobacteria bacterium]MBW1952690.1 ABC transporter permease [Deltaproteobacteria bacterium]MBW1985794.1 ABC transporter permease [Deltaproteobacteria bacterium]MBW2133888.1 ABC transporter permease [Deltaproteobacteria bacterium]